MDRLTAMRVFTEVATSGSFSATAERLEMSRAMVTRYVGEMEQWLQWLDSVKQIKAQIFVTGQPSRT